MLYLKSLYPTDNARGKVGSGPAVRRRRVEASLDWGGKWRARWQGGKVEDPFGCEEKISASVSHV